MRGIIQHFRIIRVSKKFMNKKGLSLFSFETSFFSQCRKISWGESLNVSEIFGHGKFFCRRRKYHYFLFQVFFLAVPKSFMRGIIQRFRIIRVSKNFMQKKGLSLLSVETSFFSQCRKPSWEELINVSEILGHGKVFCRGSRYHYFLLEFFFLTVPINFAGGINQCSRKIRA